MLRRLTLRDFVIVAELEVELQAGFTVLTGETGAGKSILIDALQLALGSRAEAAVVREGAARTEIGAEFDTPSALRGWLDEAGFEAGDTLLLRRVIDTQGRSRAWINGSAATVAQLREAADHLVEIHGQHAWQRLTRPAAVRELLDVQAGLDAAPLAALHAAWRQAAQALAAARARHGELDRERERLSWQIGELARLAPTAGEWDELDAEHQRLSHAQALLDGARDALAALQGDEDGRGAADGADRLLQRALDALAGVVTYDARLGPVAEVLQSAQVQLQDAAHSLNSYLGHADLDPERLAELDARLSAWMALARRYRCPPAELPELLARWETELRALEAAADLEALEAGVGRALAAWQREAERVSAQRRAAAPVLAEAVTQAMQQLGMGGGRFEVALLPQDEPQAHGLESVELRVAGHAGTTPRALAKVASGGELSRLALAIAVSTCRPAATPADPAAGTVGGSPATLIFDEIDAGVGGAVADVVGRLMKQLGAEHQVLAVTHLAQVAACADHHHVVAKALHGGTTQSEVRPVAGEARVAEIARMLGGGHLAGTSAAHAEAMLREGAAGAPARTATPRPPRRART